MLFERMRPGQIREAVAAGLPFVLPIGVQEYHGEHLPVGMDLLAVTEVLLEAALDEAEDLEDLERRLYAGGLAYARLNTPEARFERAMILARAGKSERLMEILGQQQQELTDAYEAMFRRAHRPDGWLDPDLDPKAMAVFIQTYTFGRIVDDITTNQMEQEKWMELTFAVFLRTFVRDPQRRRS